MKESPLPYLLLLFVAASGYTGGCNSRKQETDQTEIAVTNSYLQCAAEDLCQGQTDILCLTPSGMCPGHFDISPAQVNQLCSCRILLLFDFQQRIEESLLRLKDQGLKTGVIQASQGLCIPATYLAACRQVEHYLSLEYPENQAVYQQRIKQIEERMDTLSRELLREVNKAGLESTPVLVSHRQSQFCAWLGLKILDTFTSSDTETVANIHRCLEKAQVASVRFVIANRQEGADLAEALAQRLGAKVAVFSNFPDVDNWPARNGGFDRLVRENVRVLLDAKNP